MNTLHCEIIATIKPDGDILLAFILRNGEKEPVALSFFRPFCDFSLRAIIDECEVPIIQPLFDTGVHPVSIDLAADDSVRLDTPIHLCFDPAVGPAGGDDPTCWSIKHETAPVLLVATVILQDHQYPCQVRLNP